MKPKYVFVSYAREDRDYMNMLVPALKAAGVSVWVDHEINYGDRWVEVVRDRIDGCAAMIVVMSPAAENSLWVAREIARAELKMRKIVPILISGEAFFRLGDVHFFDARKRAVVDEAFVRHLLLTIGYSLPNETRASPGLRAVLIGEAAETHRITQLEQALALRGVSCELDLGSDISTILAERRLSRAPDPLVLCTSRSLKSFERQTFGLLRSADRQAIIVLLVGNELPRRFQYDLWNGIAIDLNSNTGMTRLIDWISPQS